MAPPITATPVSTPQAFARTLALTDPPTEATGKKKYVFLWDRRSKTITIQ
jgi:hypothetical protein